MTDNGGAQPSVVEGAGSPPPLVVADGDHAFREAVDRARTSGHVVVDGWVPTAAVAVHAGVVTDAREAAAALVVAVAGRGLVALATPGSPVTDAFLDDLRRVGPVEIRLGDSRPDALTPDEQALVALLAEGCTVADAARRLFLSARTASRLVGSVRTKLGAASTAEAVVRWRALAR